MKITLQQIKKVHALKNAIKMTDEDYRLMVTEVHGFSGTSKDLSESEASILIDRLVAIARPMGVWEDRGTAGKKKYEDLGKRGIQWATPKQCRMVESMFYEISFYKDNRKAFEYALRNFLHRIVHIDDIKFLEKRDVNKVVKALERMKQQKNNPPLHPSQEGTKGGQEGR